MINVLRCRLPVLTEETEKKLLVRKRRQAEINEPEEYFDFDFDSFETNFEEISDPVLDPNFEPSIDLPAGEFKSNHLSRK